MSEIKFRAWDKIEKRIEEVVDFTRTWVSIPVPDEDGCHLEQRKMEDIELMQYTGLKDKNGTEIYEGDILNHHYHKEIGDIRWEEKRATFLLFYTDGLKDGLLSVDRPSYEIIGNIYENPNLLKK